MRFRNEYFFLSNMYNIPITMIVNGVPHTFACVEAAYQAHKNLSRVDEFEGISGYEAKKLGKHIALRKDWEVVKDSVMLECLRVKFSGTYMRRKLLSINEPIVEDNTWGDTYWGCCNGVGQNRLGQLLEQIKLEITESYEVM